MPVTSVLGYIDPAELDDRDLPLNFNCLPDPELLARLGIVAPSVLHAEAMRRMIADLARAAERDRAVSYSRRNDHYSGQQRYRGEAYRRDLVCWAADTLISADLAHGRTARARPPRKGLLNKQSIIWATPELVAIYRGTSAVFERRELVCLRDGDGKDIDYRETAETVRMRRQLCGINANLAQCQLTFANDNVAVTDFHYIMPNGVCVPRVVPHVYRVHSRGSFRCGGRAYGPHQLLPGEWRGCLRIGGEAIAIPDYSCLHGQMLYAKRGLACPADCYTLRGFSRDEGKYGFLIAINAATPRAAAGAIVGKTGMERDRAYQLIDAVKKKHEPIADAFGSDRGIRLMRQDSDLIIDCVLACQKAGIAALPIHDALVVRERDAQAAAEIMVRCFERRFRPVTPCQLKITTPRFAA